MRALLVASSLCLAACGGPPLPFTWSPKATLAPPVSKVSPPPGVFNGELKLIFTTDRPATIYLSTDGSDPRNTTAGRVQGPSPLELVIKATSTVSWFASADGKDEELHTGTWTRAGGPKGTISGVVVVGAFAVGKSIGVARNLSLQTLPRQTAPSEVPFLFEGVFTGTHQLVAMMDRNGDGQLIPLVDYQSPQVAITIDLNDPYKASAEGVRLYLGASAIDLCTISGSISLPDPMLGATLRISALSPDSFLSGFDPQTLLTQLQAGYQIFTNPTDTVYPYVITDLKPGRYVLAPALIGFGAGGLAMNFIANPLRPVSCEAGQEATQDFAFGPVSISGTVIHHPMTAPAGVVYGVVAARNSSLTDGIQAVLMPAVLAQDGTTGTYAGNYAGQALRPNVSFQLRTFMSTSTAMNPLTDALQWAVNPFASQPPLVTLPVGTSPVVQDLNAP
ncbi:MAG: hypothetical protein IPJ65_07630 [Archangiaceae bacterium]|nr:hypothetical protein [Archangiaceae bacterium]